MNTNELIQTPITGREKNNNQHEAVQALSQFYLALNSRDLELMEQNWSDSPESAMDNPLGGIKRGWEAIGQVYAKLFASRGSYSFEFYGYTMHEVGDLFYVVGRERGELNLSGRPMQLTIRTSRIFRRDVDGRWRQVHHHGSIDDPQMLAGYQEAVLGKSSLGNADK